MNTIDILLEVFYLLIGIILSITSIRVFLDKNFKYRLGTSAFWLLMAILFAFGNYLPSAITGVIILIIGILTGFKQVRISSLKPLDETFAQISSERIGTKIFLPCIVLALVAVLISQYTTLGGLVGICIASVLAIALAMIFTGISKKNAIEDTDRMVQQVGTSVFLPQLLAALGVIFDRSGVGEILSSRISYIVPENNILAGVIAYGLGMVIFTMVMGNSFAAFTVITSGIGIPFVIMQGGDPVIAAATALTIGSCGTLMTPMAANFNILPAALLEMKNTYGIIKKQILFAITMIILQILLIYFWAF